MRQVAALRHALTFPALERLVYSTCSIHAGKLFLTGVSC